MSKKKKKEEPSLSPEEQLLTLVRRLKEDPIFYFRECLKIQKFGSGELIPFELNQVQQILHYMMERQLRDQDHVRMVVLKARRFGVSTFVQGRYFRHAALNRNKVVQITTHSKSATDVMFSMARIMEENMPKELKPKMKYSGKRELHWGGDGGGLNSSYSLSTVGGSEVRGAKVDYLHCSEVASWGQGGEEYLLGLLNCVVQGFQTEAVIESTAQGTGGIFHDMFWDAYDGQSGWEAVFFPWFVFSYYERPFEGEDDKERFREDLGNDPRYGGEEEVKLLGQEISFDVGLEEPLTFKVTLEKLNWRRHCIRTQCQNDLKKFHQEYPSTAREAFVTTGRSVFQQDALLELLLDSEKRQRDDPSLGYTIPVHLWKEGKSKERYVIEAQDDGELQVWQKPLEGRDYRIGVDVSEGLEVGRDTDWSVACVLDASTFEEVAMLRTKIDPDLLAWKLASLGLWYGGRTKPSMIICERNNHGLVTLKFLQEIHNYPNLYSEKILDERSSRTARKLGFHTTVKSKPLIVDYLKELIREREIKIHSPKLIDELQTFVNYPTGRQATQPGTHDDCVMALAIAAFGCKMYPASLPPPPRYYRGRPPIGMYVPSNI